MGNENTLKILHAYGEVLATHGPVPGCVADESKLPYSKKEIKEAIITTLQSTEDEKIKDSLRVGYIQLADWQQGVGTEDYGFDPAKIDINLDTNELAKAVIEQTSGTTDWTVIADSEMKTLKQDLQDLDLWCKK